MKIINLLSDKIDYLFRRGKNADERCYDFFIRTVTFLLITLIVLCYGSFVHADGDTVNGTVATDNIGYVITLDDAKDEFIQTYGADVYRPLDGSALYYTLPDYDYMSEDFLKSFNFPFGGSGRLFVGIYNTFVDVSCDYTEQYMLIVPCNRSFYIEGSGNISFPTNSTSISYQVFFVNKQTQYICQRGVNGCYIKNFDTSLTSTYCPCIAVNYDFTNSQYTYAFVDGSKSGNGIDLGPIVYTNAPVFTIGSGITSNMFSNTDYDSIINPVYGNGSDYFVQSNPLILDGTFNNDGSYNGGGSDNVESNANHNYLTDIQIGLTSQNLGQNILSSQVVIGCDVDDWILNNLDDYSMYINYKFYIKDSYQSSPNDPEFNYSVILPLRTFYNRAYTYSVAELFRNCKDSNNQSFQSYFNIVGEGQKVLSEQPYNAIIPCFLETIYQGLGKYYVTPDTEYQTIPYTIFQFKLDVSCSLSYQDMSVDDASGIYLKEFDFKNGSESVKVADILRNDNPWEGESEPQQSPIVPPANNPISGGGGSSSVSVNVDVSGQKIPIGVKTKQEIQIILDNYKEVNDTFMDDWQDLSEPMNNNNFMHFLSDTTRTLPAVDYMIKGACAVFGLSIILFVLKVLLF